MTAFLRVAADIVAVLTAISAILAAIPGSPLRNAIEAWISRRVTHQFDKALEDHRHQLALEAERVKAHYQTDIHNLAIVAERRHEVSRELFSRTFQAQGAVAGLFGFRTVPDFKQYSTEEIRQYMEERRFGSAARDQVLGAWETDRKEAIQSVQETDRTIEVNAAMHEYAAAWNYYLANSLYMPDEVTDAAKKVFDVLWEIIGNAKLPDGPKPRDSLELRRQSSDLVWELRRVLQLQLGIRVESPPDPRAPAA